MTTTRPFAAARRVCMVSVLWAIAVTTSALAAGIPAGSIALVGFGLESAVDGGASAVLLLRFGGDGGSRARWAPSEGAARRSVGAVLVVVAVYVAALSVHSLEAHAVAATSAAGVVLAAVFVVALPVLSVVKIRLAGRLTSRALRADGVLSGGGAALAAAVLLGLALNSSLGWRWADPAAAICIAVAMAVEGLRAFREDQTARGAGRTGD